MHENDHKPMDAPAPVIRPAAGVRRIAAFLILVGCLATGMDALINLGLRQITTSDFGVTNRLVSGKINAEIIISGSSRALVHYDPRIIQSVTGHTAYNIGRNGAQTDMQLAVLKAYLRHNAKPRLVIHNLDLFSFTTSREIYDPAQYIPYLHSEAIFEGVRRIYPSAWKWRYLPLYGYLVEDMRFTWLKGLKALAGMMPAEDHFQGFVPRQLKWTEDFENFRRNNPQGVTFAIEPQGQRDIEEIAALCQQAAIPLIFAYAPEYIGMQAMEANRDEIFSRFDEINRRFGAQLWDYSTSPLCLDQKYFYNSQHLNADGAALFSAALARRLANEFKSAK